MLCAEVIEQTVKLEATRSDSNTCHGWLAALQSMAKEGIGSCGAGGICPPENSMASVGLSSRLCQTLLTIREIGPAGIPSGAKHRREAGGEIWS